MNILILKDNSAIYNDFLKILSKTSFSVDCALDWRDSNGISKYLSNHARKIVIICVRFHSEEIYKQIVMMSHEIEEYLLLVTSRHDSVSSRLAIEISAQWIFSTEEDADALSSILHFISRKQTYILQNKAHKTQRTFTQFIKGNILYDEKNNVQLGFKFYRNQPNYQVAIVRFLRPYNEKMIFERAFYQEFEEAGLLMNRLDELEKCFIFKDEMDIIICMMGSDEEIERSKELIKGFAKGIEKHNLFSLRLGFWAFLGNIVHELKDIPNSYQSAKNLISERVFLKSGSVIESDYYLTNKYIADQNDIDISNVKKKLLNALELLDENVIHEALHDFKKDIKLASNVSGGLLFSLFKQLIAIPFLRLDSRHNCQLQNFDYYLVLKQYEFCWNVSDVFICIENAYGNIIKYFRDEEEDLTLSAINDAKRYVRMYFDMPLTLKEVSEYVGMKETYFSYYFSKHVHMTFKQYQTDLRIKYSKQLLLNKQNTITKVAELVGFNDVKYFSRVFKAMTGMSPGEYRDSV